MISGLMRGGLWLLQLFPPSVAWLLAGGISRLFYWSGGKVARITRLNLQVCYPRLDERQLRTLCLASLRHMALLAFEFAQLAYWHEDKLLGQIKQVQGRDLLDQAFADERGVLLLVPHFGNWEILCAFLGKHYTLAALYAPPKLAALEPVIVDARERYQAQMFPIDTGGIRSLIRLLKQGQLVAILPDQVPDQNAGTYAEFFGQPALTMNLTHRLISRNSPTVLMGSVQRQRDQHGYHYVVRFEQGPEAAADEAAADEAATLRGINQAIEGIVARAPEQYQWEYKRFKRPPGGKQASIYRRQ